MRLAKQIGNPLFFIVEMLYLTENQTKIRFLLM